MKFIRILPVKLILATLAVAWFAISGNQVIAADNQIPEKFLGEWNTTGESFFYTYIYSVKLNPDHSCSYKTSRIFEASEISLAHQEQIALSGTWTFQDGTFNAKMTIQRWEQRWPSNTPGNSSSHEKFVRFNPPLNSFDFTFVIRDGGLSSGDFRVKIGDSGIDPQMGTLARGPGQDQADLINGASPELISTKNPPGFENGNTQKAVEPLNETPLSAASSAKIEPAYPIHSSGNRGYNISAVFSGLSITTPAGSKIQLSEPFVTPNTKEEPIAPIECCWDPSNKWVAIFVPQKRVTSIYVVDLKTSEKLKQSFPKITYPKWYDGVYSTTDHPEAWDGVKLRVNTAVKLRGGGTEKTLPQVLTISDGSFTLTPL